MDILEISVYNKSHYKYFEAGLVWYNRTKRAISGKFEYLTDLRNALFVSINDRFYLTPSKVNRFSLYVKVNEMIPDFSRFPPHLPVGSYKMIIRLLFRNDFLSQMNYYLRFIDKPVDWKKLPSFIKHEYDVKMDILEVPLYNKSHYKYLEAGLVWYNRTQRAINAKWEYLFDLHNNLFADVQLYKMMSNEYRFFPVTFKASVCTEWKKNSFGAKDLLTRYSNLDVCNLRKGFPYTINKMILDTSRFPPHMPVGSYKLVTRFLVHSDFNCQVDLYIRFVDKPIDWKKLPSLG
ncbi:hypothetical protein ILUMI_19395 [Ignelater luminosus]|uniref:Uncharacterized protein n=1 Tax=Ignelater luminosus TaxID=2038154 RepID=A0A8K0CG97_IGNLU|nr:hypothetical protein ILUMI_19395 [Ignelater luminosus]